MTEIFSRRPRGARFLAALAAATTVGAMLPLFGTAVASAAPASCVSPANLASFDASRTGAAELKDPVLSWSPVAGASAYQVEVSPNEDFTNNVFINDSTVSTRYEPNEGVLAHGSYFWRVRSAGASCWSDDTASAAQFTQGWADCPAELIPVPASVTARPVDCNSGSVVSDNSTAAQIASSTGYLDPTDVRFTWSPIPDASYYDLEVSSSPDFPEASNTQGAGAGTQGDVAKSFDCFTANTSFTPYTAIATTTEAERLSGPTSCFSQSDVSADQTYYWRVRGLDSIGGSINGKPYTVAQIGVTHNPPADASATSAVTVTRVSPNSYTGPGQTVRIDGSGFTSAATVSFGTIAVDPSKIDFVNSTELLAAVPAPGASTGAVDIIVSVGAISNQASSNDKFNYGTSTTGGTVTDLAGFEVSSWAPTIPFCVKVTATSTTCAGNAVGVTPAAPTTSIAALPDGAGNLQRCDAATGTTAICAGTPTLGWLPIAGATEYRIYVASDAALSNIVRIYETHELTLTPRDDLLDSQAGKTWFVAVQACTDASCGAVSPTFTFAKRSEPIHATASSTSPQGVTVLDSTDGAAVSPVSSTIPSKAQDVTYAWGDYVCSSPEGANPPSVTGFNDCRKSNPTPAPAAYRTIDAAAYHLQVATDCDFTNVVDEATVDTNEYTPRTKILGDGAYYVRVQAIDQSGNPLTYGGGNNRSTADCGAPAFTLDRTAPTPAVTVAANGSVTVTWGDINGVATPGTAQLTDLTNNTMVPASASMSGSSITLAPSPFLVPSHAYGIVVSGATDSAGNVAAASVLPAFTEAAAPTATTTGDGASLKLTYSAPVLGLTPDKVHLIADAGHVAVPATVTIVDATTAEVTASTTLTSNAAYSLFVDAGVTDATGLLQAVTGDISGSIKSPFPPGISSARSKEGVYTARVDQAVSGFTADKVHLYTDSTMVDVPASVVISGQTATVTAAVTLIPGESYGLRVDGGIVGLDHVAVPSGPIPGTFREATKEDSNLLTRNGHWADRVARGSDNGSALVSGSGNASLSGRFRSSVLTVAYCVGPMDGYLTISIDGKTVKTFNTRNAFTACGKKLSFRGFSGAIQHTVNFKKTGKKGSAKGGTQVVIDYINAG